MAEPKQTLLTSYLHQNSQENCASESPEICKPRTLPHNTKNGNVEELSCANSAEKAQLFSRSRRKIKAPRHFHDDESYFSPHRNSAQRNKQKKTRNPNPNLANISGIVSNISPEIIENPTGFKPKKQKTESGPKISPGIKILEENRGEFKPKKPKNELENKGLLNGENKTEYELERERNIKKNLDFFKSLGISTHQETILQPKVKAPKPTENPRIVRAETVPLRRSARKRKGEGENLETLEGEKETYLLSFSERYRDDNWHEYSIISNERTNNIISANEQKINVDSGEERNEIVSSEERNNVLELKHSRKIMEDMNVAKIYAMDVSDFGHGALVAAGGHGGFVSVYGPDVDGDDGLVSPAQSWKVSNRWISGLKLLRRGQGFSVISSADDGRLGIWGISDNGIEDAFLMPKMLGHIDNVHSNGIFSMDEKDGRVVTVSKDSSVGFCDYGSSEIRVDRTFHGHHRGAIRDVSFRDRDVLADCGADNRICLLDYRQQDLCTLTIQSEYKFGMNFVGWSPLQESLLLTASKDPVILIYDIRNPTEFVYKLQGHVDYRVTKCYQILKPSFIGDGSIVATTGQGSKTISLYSMKDGKPVSRGYTGYNASLIFCKTEDANLSQRVWMGGKQINQYIPVNIQLDSAVKQGN